MVRCRRCGRRVPAAGRLCPACGAELKPSWRALYLSALCLAVVAGSYYLVTNVISLDRIRQQLANLSHVSLASLLPQTPVPRTPSPPPTETRATPTRIPTATPVTPTPTPSPSATETPSPGATSPAATPSSAPNATFALGAVELRAPADGAVMQGDTVVLSWRHREALPTDGVYVVTLRYWAAAREEAVTAWTSETSWTVPPDLRQKADPERREFRWSVQIMGRTPPDSSGSGAIALSPPSEVRAFVWP